MSFSSDLDGFAKEVRDRERALFVNVAAAVKDSIVEGSAVTGAPGQPVDTANLRDSWQLEFESDTLAAITTNVEYAPHVEDNVRGVTFKNHGPHSVAMTLAGFEVLVEDELRKLGGEP